MQRLILRDRMYAELTNGESGMFPPEGKVVAFDRKAARWVDSSEIVEINVELNGELVGKTKVLGCLDDDITKRNLKWIGHVTIDGGKQLNVSKADLEVDKVVGIIRVGIKLEGD